MDAFSGRFAPQLTRPAPPLHRSGSRSCGSPGGLILTNAKGSIGWAGTPGGVCNNRHPSRPNPSGSTSTITIGISSVLVCSVDLGCEKGPKWDNTSAPLVGWPGTPNPAKLWTNTAAAAAAANIHSRPSGSFQKGPQDPAGHSSPFLTTHIHTLTYTYIIHSSHPLTLTLTLTWSPLAPTIVGNCFGNPVSRIPYPVPTRCPRGTSVGNNNNNRPTTNPRTTALVTLPTETKSPPGGHCTSSTVSKESVFGLCLPHSCADSPPNGLDHPRNGNGTWGIRSPQVLIVKVNRALDLHKE
uniref:Uncharacterized protein n=1 Tax=Neurospora crassa TaxID=5141 RepID=Q6MFD4_NEUCS|nr:hypothetical protein [Neurospora crassa]